jgi:hypothetical protein
MTNCRQRDFPAVVIVAAMKLNVKDSARVLTMLSVLAFAPMWTAKAQTNSPAAAVDTHYGLFNWLDHRSSYGQGIFPEPFLVDDSDLEVNEARLDWIHTKARGSTGDEVTAEIEKGFGLLTVEAEFHYERESAAGHVVDGIGNIDLGARYPFYQFVAQNGLVDTTLGAGIEVGIPVHSSVSKNTELVPKLFNDLRLGSHLTLQTIVGYSTLFGGGEEGGAQAFEYGLDLGYTNPHSQLRIPHVQQLIPLFEVSGETALNHGASGRNSVIGVAGFRVNLDAIGRVQPRLGLGFIFPLNGEARNDVHWGIATSLVFEY